MREIDPIIVISSTLVIAMALLVAVTIKHRKEIPKVAVEWGVQKGDLEAFLRATDYSIEEFKESPGVRAHFERWPLR